MNWKIKSTLLTIVFFIVFTPLFAGNAFANGTPRIQPPDFNDPGEFSPDYEGDLWGGLGSFQPAWHFIELTDLNNSMNEAGLESFNDGMMKFGGGGGGYFSSVYLGGRGGGFVSRNDDGNVRNSLSGGLGFFQIGYAVLHSYTYILTPVAGIGSGSYTLEIESNDPPFNGIRTEETESAMLLDLAVNFDFFPMLRNLPAKVGLSIGLQGGYILSLGDMNWRTSNLPLEEMNIESLGLPGMTGFYAGISIGGGFTAPN